MRQYCVILTYLVFCVPKMLFALDLTNTSGQVYSNVTIKENRPDGLKVFHSTGVAFLPFRELPETIQKEYGYDAQKEKEFLRLQAEAEARRQEQQLHTDALQRIRNSGLKATLRIIQITDEGTLVTGYYTTEKEYEHTEYRTVTKKVGLGGSQIDNTVTKQIPVKTEKLTQTNQHDLPDSIFVVGVLPNLVDGDWFTTMIYPCGRHQYVTVMGGRATVERYATSPIVAKKLLGY